MTYSELKPLTKRQQEIFDFILECMNENGAPPTRVEIASHFGFRSPNAAEDHLKALHVVGDVAAGAPILATEHVQQYVNVDQSLFADNADFMLKVRGDSMINIGIFEQDLLAIKKTDTAQENQIVVARIDDDVTVKRYHRTGAQVLLLAENDDYEPIEVNLQTQSFAIEGVVVGLIRQGL